jgi:hypothetical protein
MNQAHTTRQENYHITLSNNLMPRYDALSCIISKHWFRATQSMAKQNFRGVYKAGFHNTCVYVIYKYNGFIHT